MTVETYYIADDGKKFETEEDCLMYEKREKFFSSLKDVLLFDKDGKEISKTCFFTDMEEYIYIYIGSRESYKIIQRLNEEVNIAIPPKEGFWRYQYEIVDRCEVFVNCNEEIKKIKKELDKYSNMDFLIECRLNNIE